MKTINKMKLSFPSKSCNEAFARTAVSAFIMNLDPTVNELSDLKTAVSEAVTNCIVHGYRRQDGTIYISGAIREDNRVIIKVRDSGCGIADVEQAMKPLFTTAKIATYSFLIALVTVLMASASLRCFLLMV